MSKFAFIQQGKVSHQIGLAPEIQWKTMVTDKDSGDVPLQTVQVQASSERPKHFHLTQAVRCFECGTETVERHAHASELMAGFKQTADIVSYFQTRQFPSYNNQASSTLLLLIHIVPPCCSQHTLKGKNV